MARALRPLLPVLVALALALPASASAFTGYDPDLSGLSPTPSADLSVGSGTCTFDTTLGAIDGPGCPSARGMGANSTVVDGIGVVVLPSTMPGQPDTMEFVMRSLTAVSGSHITYSGNDNLVIATLKDFTLPAGSTVNADGLGEPGGSPGTAGGGPGGGDHSPFSLCGDAGGGGSFGDNGGDGGNGVPSGGSYGSTDQSQFLNDGSGGGGGGSPTSCGTTPGGDGGGGVGLLALGTLTLDGTISANGTPGAATADLSDQGGPGGGSGGGILIMSPHVLLGSGAVGQANGGFGYSTSLTDASGGGGGSGGRITVISDQAQSALASHFSIDSGDGGMTTDPGDPIQGLVGGDGNPGTFAGLPFLKIGGPTTKRVGEVATFTATQAFGHSTLSWNFGDGSSGSGANTSHTYTAPGNYTVTVTATMTDSGQTSSAQRSISVTAPPTPPATGNGGGGGTAPPTPTPAVQHCVVPKLKGLSLKAAKRKLARAHCKLGKVKKPKLRKSTKKKTHLVIVRQPAVNKTFPAGTKVNVTLGPKKPKHHKRH